HIILLLEFSGEIEPFLRLEHRPLVRGINKSLLPLSYALGQVGRLFDGGLFELFDLRQDLLALFFLLSCWHVDESLVVVVQERIKLVILFLSEGIVFVIVALAAVNRQTEERFAQS